MILCENKNKFIYEVRPDLFPPFLTDTETELWGIFYEWKKDIG